MPAADKKKMRTKNLIYFLMVVIGISIIICLFTDQSPNLHTLVTETHKHLNNQLNNLKNLKENLKANDQTELTTDEKYLKALGFTENPRLYPEAVWKNVTLPVVTTAVGDGQWRQVINLLKSVHHYLPDYSIIIFDLGLGDYELAVISKYCNSTNCTVRKFAFDQYPAHVKSSSISAYRPIIIQEVLNQVGAIFWMDPNYRLVSNKVESLIAQASNSGVVAWSINQPTTVLTHPRMFEYFHMQPENFYFHRMVEPSRLIAFNTDQIHNKLMLPWVQCALTFECVAPIGAQSSGCRFDKKPLYRYSGCHRYDMSAFNVVLGRMFEYNATAYTVRDRIFRTAREDALINSDSENETMSAKDNSEY